MERGDLSAWSVPRMVAVLEGVLIDVDMLTSKGMFGREKVVAVNWS